jgi:hypothetical protein
MSRSFFRILGLIVLVPMLVDAAAGAQGRIEINLDSAGWKVWLDEAATWKDDKLYLPAEVDVAKLSVNPPTGGWEQLYARTSSEYSLPLVVEEIFSKGQSTWTWHGVSWFSSNFDVPAGWEKKVVRLEVQKANSRVEIYINEKLAGYDLVAGTPFTSDISRFLVPGTKNRIAFRITNPGGQRGWSDFPLIDWGKYKMLPHHDFSGIGGTVKLYVTDPLYVEDVFVKNLLPAHANHIEVETTLKNSDGQAGRAKLAIKIISAKTGETVYSSELTADIAAGPRQTVTKEFSVPQAAVWDVRHPNLYKCLVTLESAGSADSYEQTFGFRVFEAKANARDEQNYYLNGKRIRLRSAIDWGYYAYRGYYATPEMAARSVNAALSIGNNMISQHRNIGDPQLIKAADQGGLLIYEEPGGFDDSILDHVVADKDFHLITTFEGQLIAEKCRRMVLRDRNHPAVIIFNLANERNSWDLIHRKVMTAMHDLDDTKMIVNQSGGVPGGPSGDIPHMRPYEHMIRADYMDDHTVGAEGRFQEIDFASHRSAIDRMNGGIVGNIDPQKRDHIVHWGEVRCFAAPDNWYKSAQEAATLPEGRTGYDRNTFEPLSAKIADYFKLNRLNETGSRVIHGPEDVSLQAGRATMYTDGRISQIILSNDAESGFAINAWSGGSFPLPPDHLPWLEWYSGIVDEARNLKGPALDFSWWTRPLQVAIFRHNGKYFHPGDKMSFDIYLINEGRLPAGDLTLSLGILDGAGHDTGIQKKIPFTVRGGDTYAQLIASEVTFTIESSWHAGYITVSALLLDKDKIVNDGDIIVDGAEQVLLQNRPSYAKELASVKGVVSNWPAATQALTDAGQKPADFAHASGKLDYILAGDLPTEADLTAMLKKVNSGTRLIVKFNAAWADALFAQGILKEKITQWGGEQTDNWWGNGWGYIDHFIGDQALPSKTTIGTRAWEVSSDPKGFGPFVAATQQTAYGAYFARPDKLLVLIGEVQYGKGKIILAPGYAVDDNQAFNDLLFYNMILK